jgi:HEPN domain-containing protein
MESKNIILAEDWMYYVRLDLRWLDFWDENDPDITGGVAVLSQQAIEKSLKAYLALFLGPDIPKIHDLKKLFEEVRKYKDFVIDDDVLDDLSGLYIVERYPAKIAFLANRKPPSIERALKYSANAKSVSRAVAAEIEQAKAALALNPSTTQKST